MWRRSWDQIYRRVNGTHERFDACVARGGMRVRYIFNIISATRERRTNMIAMKNIAIKTVDFYRNRAL